MEIVTGEASKGYKNKNPEIERSKTIDKYAKMNRFHSDLRLQVYMYAFMYVYPDKMP